VGASPRTLIEELSESLLHAFIDLRLIDAYDVYQHLMNYWAETMQDDIYLIAAEGWLEANKLRTLEPKSKETPDLTVEKVKFKADLIPPALIMARYFAADQQALDALQTESEELARQMDEITEEEGGEDGLLHEALNDKGKVTKATLTARIKEIFDDPDFADELDVLNDYLGLMNQASTLKAKIKAAQRALDTKVIAKYRSLTEKETKDLVVDDKWLAALTDDVRIEQDRVCQVLDRRTRELYERYTTPLPTFTEKAETLSRTVDLHLRKMGFVWN
jgi:type I restriction enzyme M protein